MTDLNHSHEDVRDMLETKDFGTGRQEVFDLCEDYLTLLAENKKLRRDVAELAEAWATETGERVF